MIIRNLSKIALTTSIILLTSCAHKITNNDANSNYYHGSKKAFPEKIAASGKREFVFSPVKLAWGAYSADGELVGYGRASGGADFNHELKRQSHTPTGLFHVRSKGEYNCRSSKYPLPHGGALMPYCMFFLKNYAIHGAPPQSVPNYNASHGCIRLTNSAAKWLRYNFINIGTRVKVLPYK